MNVAVGLGVTVYVAVGVAVSVLVAVGVGVLGAIRPASILSSVWPEVTVTAALPEASGLLSVAGVPWPVLVKL